MTPDVTNTVKIIAAVAGSLRLTRMRDSNSSIE